MKELFDLRILAVEDEPALREMLSGILHAAGFRQVRTAASCAEARQALHAWRPEGVLLDIMLPDGDGFSLLRAMRAVRDVPILFLSARDADADRLRGLGLGADDYITKPFLPDELVLRLTAVLRRAYSAGLAREGDVLRLGSVAVDWGSGTAERNGRTVSLTAKEYALLRTLCDNRGNIVTIDALISAAWGEDNFGYENTLMVHIRRLREKIEDDPSHPRYLLTARGLGYKLAREGET